MISAQEFKERFIDDWKPTPLVNIEGVLFKDESKNPTGSVKARGLSWQIYKLLEEGVNEAVISSSGNAALAGAFYASSAGIKLHVFIPPKVGPEKLERLNEYQAVINVTQNPITDAEEYAAKHDLVLIRQSKDENAIFGFRQLASELSKQMSDLKLDFSNSSIFFPVSSGTTVVGFYEGLSSMDLSALPQIHIVQTPAVQTIAKEFDTSQKRKARSIVPGIVARKVANTYKKQVLEAVNETNGSGWVVPDEDTKRASEWLHHNGMETSLEGALALAGFWKAKNKYQLKENTIILLT